MNHGAARFGMATRDRAGENHRKEGGGSLAVPRPSLEEGEPHASHALDLKMTGLGEGVRRKLDWLILRTLVVVWWMKLILLQSNVQRRRRRRGAVPS